jgi:ribonuclease HII
VQVMQPHRAPDLGTESSLFATGAALVGCVDEAGRGPLAGGVHVGIVVVGPFTETLAGVNDSKRLDERSRLALVPRISEWAVASAVGASSSAEIDDLGMMRALRLALRRALAQLPRVPDAVVMDGNFDFLNRPLPVPGEPWTGTLDVITLPYGDSRSAGVAAASVLAKTQRDEEMIGLDLVHPGYGWSANKGYGTPAHRDAIRRLGPSPLHRRSFRLL